MSVLQQLRSALGLGSTEDGFEQLRQLLLEREATLELTATYGQPYADMQGEPTAVFPYTTFTTDGDVYRVGQKEFVIPDSGLDESDSALAQFVAKRLGISTSAVDFDALASVEGTEASATLNEDGDVVVGA